MAIEYLGLSAINGPMVVLEGVSGAAYDEIVEMVVDGNKKKLGRVIEVYEDKAIIQVFEGTEGLGLRNVHTRLTGHPMVLGVSEDMLGRTMNGTGVPIDGLISDSLLLNIFEPDTPLHDGAVVIRGNRIVAASCLLPLTEARNLSQELGTRHRSAIGISEQSDALVLVVSEETGTISLARNGELHRYLTGEDIKSLLRAAVVQPSLNWKQVINDKIKEIRGGK